jgi:uncharacterized Tic20 family protein
MHSSGHSKDELNLAMWSHLIPVLATATGLGLFGFLGPLLIRQTSNVQSAFLEQHTRASLNFQISMLIYYAMSTVLIIIVGVVTLGLGLILAFPIFGILIVGSIALGIVGSIKATNGEHFNYMFSINFIK